MAVAEAVVQRCHFAAGRAGAGRGAVFGAGAGRGEEDAGVGGGLAFAFLLGGDEVADRAEDYVRFDDVGGAAWDAESRAGG